nr:acetolactate synthase large subunit [Ornithinicoccus hortensis]
MPGQKPPPRPTTEKRPRAPPADEEEQMTAQTAVAQATGAQTLVSTLQSVGVEHIFGLPGGAVLPLYDALYQAPGLRHVLVRHEQGAGHAAQGYAMATGKVGVCLATSGPGATNLVTPLADANMDSVPMVAITGNVPSGAIGSDAFQEADIRSIAMPVTKHSFLVTDPDQIAGTVRAAFHLAASGRPGPVLVDVSKDAFTALTSGTEAPLAMTGYNPQTTAAPEAVRDAAAMVRAARKPVLYVGGGTLKAGAHAELRALADLTGIPVVTTLMARGVFPDSHPQHMGMPGMHGSVTAVAALQKSDLIVSLGARFDDRVTGQRESFAPHAKVVHADIDPSEINKVRHADVALVGDCKETIAALTQELVGGEGGADYAEWLAFLSRMRMRYPVGYDIPADGSVSPQQVIERIGQIAGPDAVYASGVGQHQMWAAHFLGFEKPRTWLNSGGLGTMGYAVPAAMGAKLGRPEATVWAIDGDGCFQMTNQELATCAVEGIPIKVAVINNGALGMVRQWQTLFYDQRYSHSTLHSTQVPDFVGLSRALGCVGLLCDRPEDVDATIHRAMEIDDQPVVVDFRVSQEAQVWPMVASGTSNDAIQYAKGMAPVFEEDD